MVNWNAVNFFPPGNLSQVLPPRRMQPRWKIWDWRDYLDERFRAAGKVQHALMNEDSLKRLNLVRIQTCECQDSQAQSS